MDGENRENNSNLEDLNRDRKPPSRFGAGTGIALAIVLHILVFVLILLIDSNWMSVYLGFGLFQLVYIAPFAIVFKAKGYKQVAAGMWIIAGVSFLLNAACWGLVGLPVLFR